MDYKAFFSTVSLNTSKEPTRSLLSSRRLSLISLPEMYRPGLCFLTVSINFDSNSAQLHLCNFRLRSCDLFVGPHQESPPFL